MTEEIINGNSIDIGYRLKNVGFKLSKGNRKLVMISAKKVNVDRFLKSTKYASADQKRKYFFDDQNKKIILLTATLCVLTIILRIALVIISKSRYRGLG